MSEAHHLTNASGSPASSSAKQFSSQPTPAPSFIRTPACLVLGMAGSGKTTLVEALSTWLERGSAHTDESGSEQDSDSEQESGSEQNGLVHPEIDQDALNQEIIDAIQSVKLEQSASVAPKKPSVTKNTTDASENQRLPGDGAYVINLDPAVYDIPYEPNIDIRDTIKYKKVMSEYSLGPNGAIITCLNLYATRFDQVLTLIEKRAPPCRAVIIDTPGQIETFTWSASGTIISDALGLTLPTVVLFVIDTNRCENTMTFVSNMLYACSIMYKTRLPMVIVFNKIDVKSCDVAQGWMRDYSKLEEDLKENSFLGTLSRSMAQALEQFYQMLRTVGVSAQTGEGMEQLIQCIEEAAQEYESDYRPVIEAKKKAKAEGRKVDEDEQISRIRRDMGSESEFGERSDFDEGESDEDIKFNDQDGDLERKPVSSVDRDSHSVRMTKIKGEYFDEEKDKRDYDDFLKQFNQSKKG